MAQVYGDRVLETTTGTTSPWTLVGAVAGYRAFSAVAANGDTCYYTMRLGTQWEVGLGTWSTGGILTRTTFIASSTGSAITFAAGSKEVWMDIPARLVQMFQPSINPNLINGMIVESHAGNAATFAVKTLANANPSVADPVFFVFGAIDGSTYVRIVTAALSITIASGATVGATSAKGFRIWLAALDNAGTVELVVRNCCDQATGNIAFFAGGGENRITTTVQAGAGDDLALTSYSVAARTNAPYIVLGNFSYTSLTTAGTWDASPATFNLFSRQMPRPGEVIQSRRATSSTVVVGGGGSSYVTVQAVAITLSSVAHAVRVFAYGGTIKTQNASNKAIMRLRNTTSSVTIGDDPQVLAGQSSGTFDSFYPMGVMQGVDFPSSVSAQTYAVQIADTFAIPGVAYPAAAGGVTFGSIVVEELMT